MKSELSGRAPFDPHRALGAEQPSLFGPAEPSTPTVAPEQPVVESKTENPTPKIDVPATVSVSQLNQLIKGAIKAVLPGTYHVIGELSNLSRGGGNGHVYFTLKDRTSEIRCVLWRTDAVRVKFKLEDGLEVIATGEVDVFEQRGQYQLYVKTIEPRGTGALELAFKQLREKLQREGLFEAGRKRALPKFPRRIAVVTSPTGAAIRDIVTTIQRRCSACELFVVGVRVQGEGAAAEIADAIRRINRESARLGGIDVMIVGRGGGSIEDLWAFNEEVVARAIFASKIPVISAVGHEVDFTIADFVADVRAATPTAAAELVVPVLDEMIELLLEMQRRMGRAVRGLVERAETRLRLIESYDWFRDPVTRLRHRHQHLDEIQGRLNLAQSRMLQRRWTVISQLENRLAQVQPQALLNRRRELVNAAQHRLDWALQKYLTTMEQRLRDMSLRVERASPGRAIQGGRVLAEQLEWRLVRAVNGNVNRRQEALESLETRLAASSHEKVLRRGFSITRRGADGRIVTSSKDAKKGERLETQTADGVIKSTVDE